MYPTFACGGHVAPSQFIMQSPFGTWVFDEPGQRPRFANFVAVTRVLQGEFHEVLVCTVLFVLYGAMNVTCVHHECGLV